MVKALEAAAVAIHIKIKIIFVDPHKLEPEQKSSELY
jgi:CTP synthase (UTP-ammonia lyase)